ncbi:hypothetical protein ANANG_G00072940 [Anguilla anguilla]|uniref:Uncharacterized protein n=1 Tax=Anguilla anguilla TaxID=7936 RepID=A0A9D3MR22_ANGAN|nr:hypothetical protein ANANG_G00072940 [Anguilla anguilla]
MFSTPVQGLCSAVVSIENAMRESGQLPSCVWWRARGFFKPDKATPQSTAACLIGLLITTRCAGRTSTFRVQICFWVTGDAGAYPSMHWARSQNTLWTGRQSIAGHTQHSHSIPTLVPWTSLL